MKKIIVLISCLALVFSLAVLPVSAEADGFDFLSTASKFEVNGSVVGEGVVLVTVSDNIPTSNLKWAISVVLAPTDTEGVYSVVFVHTGDGTDPAITLENGQVLLGVHSSTSNTDQASEYPNVYGKLAAQALEAGDTVVFSGIDFEAGTVSEGASIVAGGTGAPTDESEPASESAPADESVPADESAPASESTPADTSAPADASDNSVADAPAGGNNTWIYVACGVAAVIIVAVVVVMVKKK